MKILWHSAKPNVPSGYGVQTKHFIDGLTARGIDVDVSCTSGLFGTTEMLMRNGRKVMLYPHSGHPAKYGLDLVEQHFKHSKADFILSFIDCFIFDPEVVGRLPWTAWCPADSDPLMKDNIAPLKACKTILSLTKWGQKIIQQAGFECSYMPCVYDGLDYFVMDRGEAKQKLTDLFKVDFFDRPVVNVVSSNTGYRKNFPVIFEAWKMVLDHFPNALLYVHADPSGYITAGTNLFDIMELYRIPEKSVLFPPMWEYSCGMIGSDFLNLIYNASDVHLNACYGEGFGIPIVEAQAAGCPAVVPAFGGAQEVCKNKTVISGNMINAVKGGLQMLVDSSDVAEKLQQWIVCEQTNETRKVISNSVQEYEKDFVMDETVITLMEKVCSQVC